MEYIQLCAITIIIIINGTVINTSFINNTETDHGKFGEALSIHNTLVLTIIECQFIGNRAETGGAISIISTTEVTVYGCLFRDNSATRSGGAILLDNSRVNISGNDFISNSAEEYGGSIYINDYAQRDLESEYIIEGNAFISNKALQGGGLYFRGYEMESGIFSSTKILLQNGNANLNYAEGQGGFLKTPFLLVD